MVRVLDINGNLKTITTTVVTGETDPIWTAEKSDYLTILGASGVYVPLTRTITINGITHNLSANRTWTITETDPEFTTWLAGPPNLSEFNDDIGLSPVTPAALTRVNDTNVTLTLGGTPGTALLEAVSLTLGWTGTLADARIASAATWNAKQNAITTGSTAQYLRGDLSLATFPTNVSTFTNDSGYITSSALSPYLLSATAASTYQPLDADLTTIAGLTATTDNFLVSVASAWASRTPAQVRTTLGLVIGTNVQAWDTDLDTWAGITPASGIATWLATPSSANLATAVTDETGTGALCFATSPTFTTQITSPKIIGGTGTTSSLTLQTTTGVGTTNADFIVLGGNNGATEFMRITNAGAMSTFANLTVGNNLLAASAIRAGATANIFWNGRNIMSSPSDGVIAFTSSGVAANTVVLTVANERNNYVAKTTTYTAVVTDKFINCTSGTFTVTLLTAVGIAGQEFIIKNSGAGTITIATTSSQTIDGASTKTLSVQYSGYRLTSDGANWMVTGTF